MSGRGDSGDGKRGAPSEDYERLLALHHALRLNRALRDHSPLPPTTPRQADPAARAPTAPSSFDRRMIFESLRLIEPYRDHLTWYFFRRLFTDRPELRSAFSPDLDVTQHRMVETILALALDGHDAAGGRSAAADEYPQLIAYLRGEHQRHGVTAAQFPAIGEALVATMRELAGAAWRAEYDAAWQRCYHALTAAMTSPAPPPSEAPPPPPPVAPPRVAEPPPAPPPRVAEPPPAAEQPPMFRARRPVEAPRAAAQYPRTVGRSTVERPATVDDDRPATPTVPIRQAAAHAGTVEMPLVPAEPRPPQPPPRPPAEPRTPAEPRPPQPPRAAEAQRPARTTPRPTPHPYGQAAAPTREAPPATTPSHYTGTVVARERRGSSIAVLTVRPDQPYRHEAGQYAVLESPRLPGVRRPYSVAAAAGQQTLEFHVRAVPDGQLSRVLVNDTAVGDRLRLTPPRGAMTIDPASTREVLLVAGGTGLAPLKALAGTLAATAPDRPARLFFGVRRSGDLYDMPALEAIADSYPELRVVVAVSEDPDYPGVKGELPEVLRRYGGQYDNWVGHDVYVSGPPGMVAATRAQLADLGVPAGQVRSDPVDG